MSQPAPPDWSKDGEDTYKWNKADGVAVEVLHASGEPDKYNVRIIDRSVYDKEIHLKEPKPKAHTFAVDVIKEISDKHLEILKRRSSDKPADKDFNPSQNNALYLAVQKVAESY